MIQLGEYKFDKKQARLLDIRSNKEVEIEPKLLELLLFFVEQPNKIISRQELLEHLWQGSIVTDNAINKLIGNLRKVLGDEAKNSRYIQTIPKRGYRLVCQVKSINEIVSLNSENDFTEEQQLAERPKTSYILKVAIIGFSILLLFVFWRMIQSDPDSKMGYSLALTRDQGVELSPKMHPDNEHLYYIKENEKYKKRELWLKNINTAVTKRLELDSHINEIIAVTSNNESTQLIFLEKVDNHCVVNQAIITFPSIEKQIVNNIEKLFDCRDKRIKDIDYHHQQNALYYTAQPQNFWPNQIYTFDIASKRHGLVTQIEPTGWGHHSIDISPNGEKLLIMSTDSDHKTQLLALNLLTNEVIEGIKFNRPVYQAIWHHDSEKVFYYSEPPAHQIIRSDFNGEGAIAKISVSEELSSNMSRMPDGKSLLFTTESTNYDNRWLAHSSKVSAVDNSNVFDSSPALFHHSDQYLFASKRSGHMQLYLVDDNEGEAKIVTNFSQSHSLGYMSMAPDDKSVLLTLDEKVYLLPIAELSAMNPMTLLKPEYLFYSSEVPIISINWQGKQRVAITVVNSGTPELILVDLSDKKVKGLRGNWAYGLTDVTLSDSFYVIEQQSNRLYQTNLNDFSEQLDIQLDKFNDTQIVLPQEFYLVNIDNNTLYYVVAENHREYMHVVPLDNISSRAKYLLNNLSRFDVSQGNIMVSDMASQEGDIYRTVY